MRCHIRSVLVVLVFSSVAGILSAEQYVYDGHGRRNPFLPPTEGSLRDGTAGYGTAVDTAPQQKWFTDNMTGVLYDPRNPRVLIGDEIVEVGQEINGCVVVEIKPEGIVFEYARKRVEVLLRQEVEKEKKKDERK